IFEQQRATLALNAGGVQSRELPQSVEQSAPFLVPHGSGFLVGPDERLDFRARGAFGEPRHEAQMALRSFDGWHEMRGYGLPYLEIRLRDFELDLEAPPNGRVQELRVIGDADREADVAAGVEVLQQRVHDALYLAHFLRV